MIEKLDKCPVCDDTGNKMYLRAEDFFLTHEVFEIRECSGCGFRFVSPRPDEATIGSYYQSDEYISHDSGKKDLFSRIYRVARKISIRGKFNMVHECTPTGRILDVGCGTGEFLAYCAGRGYQAAGVEPSPKARTFAIGNHHLAVTEKLEQIDENGPKFNVITLWHVLEHMHDLNRTMELLNHHLAPGGTLIVAVPNCTSWDARKYEKFWAAYDVPRHLYHFTAETMDKLVTKHGFSVSRMRPQKMDAYYVAMLSDRYQSGKKSYLRPAWYGFWSNCMAGRPGFGFSSQIYLLNRKKA